MVKKTVFLILLFYILVLLQSSFLVHFSFRGIVPNFVLILAVLINILEDKSKKTGIVAGFLAGLFLDVFSAGPIFFFGFYTLISLAFSLFIKLVLKTHVQVPVLKKI